VTSEKSTLSRAPPIESRYVRLEKKGLPAPMWVISGPSGSLVWQDVGDGTDGQHDECQRRVGGMESVGAVHDHSDASAERLVARVVHSQAHRGQYPRPVGADRLGQGDEGPESAASGLRAEPVEERADLLGRQVPVEDRPKGLLQSLGAPHRPAVAAQASQGRRLLVGEVLGVLEQAPPRPLEPLGGSLVHPAHLLPVVTADPVQGRGGQGDDVRGVVADDAWGAWCSVRIDFGSPADMSIETAVTLPARSSASSSKKVSSLAVSRPSFPQTTWFFRWFETRVTYRWPRRQLTSSTPISKRSSRRRGSSFSPITRVMIRPTEFAAR